MKNFDLGIYRFPGCDVVCNRKVREHGDYKQIAHISFAGNIKYLVPVDSISEKDRETIEKCAENNRIIFTEKFELDTRKPSEDCGVVEEMNCKKSAYRVYSMMLDTLSIKEYMDFMEENDGKDVYGMIDVLREIYFQRS